MKSGDGSLTPAQLLLLPIDNYRMINFSAFHDVGIDHSEEANAFVNIHALSRSMNTNLIQLPLTNTNQYQYLSQQFYNDFLYPQAYLFGLYRQKNFISSYTILNNLTTFFDTTSYKQYLDYVTVESINNQNNLLNCNNYNFLYSTNLFNNIVSNFDT
jgi:hypothetical protein